MATLRKKTVDPDAAAADETVVRGSGNVFADLGQPDAEAHLLKADLVARIDAIVRRQKLTQAQAAKRLGLSQPDVSRLLRGNFRDYSVERLLRLLTALGRDVEIVIRKPRARRRGRVSVEAA
jgi:predicted XRE-type DNA-binding protein